MNISESPSEVAGAWPPGSHRVELLIQAALQDHDYLLTEILRPILLEYKAAGRLAGAYFMRRDIATPAGISLILGLSSPHLASSILNQLKAILGDGTNFGRFRVEGAVKSDLADLDNIFAGPAAKVFTEQFFSESCEFLLDVLIQCVSNEARVRIAFDMMTVHVWRISRSLFPDSKVSYPVCFASYRSHADGFFVMSKDPEATRDEFERRYLRNAGVLKQRLKDLLLHADAGDSAMSPLANTWSHLIAKWCDTALSKITNADLTFASSEEDPGLYLGDRFDLSVSAFQQEIQNNPAYRVFMRTDPHFLAMRVMMSFLYWSLQQLGIRLVERYLLCHCISRCFEELFSIDLCASIQAYTQTK